MNPDPMKTFYLQTDASSSGAGAVLTQELNGSKKQKPITYFSYTFFISKKEPGYNCLIMPYYALLAQ
jgi:hypothetical protein